MNRLYICLVITMFFGQAVVACGSSETKKFAADGDAATATQTNDVGQARDARGGADVGSVVYDGGRGRSDAGNAEGKDMSDIGFDVGDLAAADISGTDSGGTDADGGVIDSSMDAGVVPEGASPGECSDGADNDGDGDVDCDDADCSTSLDCPMCAPGEVYCSSSCIDPMTHDQYCGATDECVGSTAGTPCAAGEQCVGGTCECESGLVRCGTECVDPLTDPRYCGATADCVGTNAGRACGVNEECSGGTCECLPGLVSCAGVCIDPQANTSYCGASGDCTGSNGGASCAQNEECSSGACVCDPGLVKCENDCIDPASNPSYCGASGDCTGADAGETCLQNELCSTGACECSSGLVECEGTCINPLTNAEFCGASGTCTDTEAGVTCPVGGTCNMGFCECPSGELDCGGVCTDPMSDPDHCGATNDCTGTSAGEVCQSGEVCNSGTCELLCSSGFIVCDGSCIDPDTNGTYCGASGDCTGNESGETCGQFEICSSGTCTLSCPTELDECAGTCVDLQTNSDHCGSCDNACSAGCVDGSCCGNGVIETGEECDDGNQIDGDGCSSDCTDSPPTSCQTLLDADSGAASGIYTLDPDGLGGVDEFDAYCDMAGSAGWTLIARGGAECGSLSESSSVSDSSGCAYRPFAEVEALSAVSSHVRLSEGGGFGSWNSHAQSTNSNNISALSTSGGDWHNGAAWDNWTWTGLTCSPSLATGWPNMFQACGNCDGVHWLQSPYNHNYRCNSPWANSTATWVR